MSWLPLSPPHPACAPSCVIGHSPIVMDIYIVKEILIRGVAIPFVLLGRKGMWEFASHVVSVVGVSILRRLDEDFRLLLACLL